MNVETLEDGRKALLNLVQSSREYLARLPPGTCSVVNELKELQSALNDLQVRCKLECLEVEKKYLDLQKPLLERWKGLISGKLQSSNMATQDAGDQDEPSETSNMLDRGIPRFWHTALNNHLSFHDFIQEHDRDALSELIDIRLEYLRESDPIPGPGYRILFEFGPNKYFENSILSKTYQYDTSRIGYSGDFGYLSAEGTEIKWKNGIDLILRVDGSYRGSFFEFFTPLTKEEIEDAAVDEEWLEALKDDIEHDYQLGAALKDEILSRALDWFTGRPLTEAYTSAPNSEDAEKLIASQSPQHGIKYGYEVVLRDASTDLAHSLLFSAAEHGHVTAIKLLLARGDVNINAQDDQGRTPLYIAARDGHETIVTYLVGHNGIDINLPHGEGATPLYNAVQNDHEAIVKLLVSQQGIDINSSDDDGATPLYIAAQDGREAIVKLLVSQDNINVNAPMRGGTTALYIAAQKGYEGIVRLLLGVDGIDLKLGYDGATPYMIAAQSGHKVIAALLEHAMGSKREHSKGSKSRFPWLKR